MRRCRAGSPSAGCDGAWRAVPPAMPGDRPGSAPRSSARRSGRRGCQGMELPRHAILPVIEMRLITEERLLVKDEQRGQEAGARPGADAERDCAPAGDDAVAEQQRIGEEEE